MCQRYSKSTKQKEQKYLECVAAYEERTLKCCCCCCCRHHRRCRRHRRRLIADLGFTPLIFWNPSTVLVVLWWCCQVLGTLVGALCPLLCSSVCILCSICG